jgi:hypothetical protein
VVADELFAIGSDSDVPDRVAGRRTVSPTRTTSTVTFLLRGSCFAGRSFMNDQVTADLATELA